MRVFLGGTCNESKWREELIPHLECEYFNPVVPDWTPACQDNERRQRDECDVVLYVITPRMTGVYAIAEAVEDAIKRPQKTVFCYRPDETIGYSGCGVGGFLQGAEFTVGAEKSLIATSELIRRNGATVVRWEDLAAELNDRAHQERYLEE